MQFLIFTGLGYDILMLGSAALKVEALPSVLHGVRMPTPHVSSQMVEAEWTGDLQRLRFWTGLIDVDRSPMFFHFQHGHIWSQCVFRLT